MQRFWYLKGEGVEFRSKPEKKRLWLDTGEIKMRYYQVEVAHFGGPLVLPFIRRWMHPRSYPLTQRRF